MQAAQKTDVEANSRFSSAPTWIHKSTRKTWTILHLPGGFLTPRGPHAWEAPTYVTPASPRAGHCPQLTDTDTHHSKSHKASPSLLPHWVKSRIQTMMTTQSLSVPLCLKMHCSLISFSITYFKNKLSKLSKGLIQRSLPKTAVMYLKIIWYSYMVYVTRKAQIKKNKFI